MKTKKKLHTNVYFVSEKVVRVTQVSEKLDVFCSKRKGWRNLLLIHTTNVYYYFGALIL